MIKDIRFFPLERNKKIFTVIIKMLVHRGLLSMEQIDNVIESLISSFDQTNQVVTCNNNEVKFKIKIITDKVSTINKIPGLLSFIENNQDTLTFIIVEDIYLKPFKDIIEYPNTEIFWIKELLRNPIEHVFFPSIKPLNPTEKQQFLEEYDIKLKDLPRMDKVDFIARYYNLNCGDIIEITRPSIASGISVCYRVITNCSWDKLFLS